MAEARMSFLPDDYVNRRLEQRTNLICLSLFAVVLVGILGAWVLLSQQRRDVLREQRRINAEYTEAAKSINQLNELHNHKVQLLRKAQITATLIEPIPRSNLLADLVNRMPSTLSLTGLEMTSKQIRQNRATQIKKKAALAKAKANNNGKPVPAANQPPPVPQYRVTVQILGLAPTDIQVAQYIAALARSPLLRTVHLAFSESVFVEGSPMRKFKVVMTLDSDADIRMINPLLASRGQGIQFNAFAKEKASAAAQLPPTE